MDDIKEILSKQVITDLLSEIVVKENIVEPEYVISYISEEHNGLSYVTRVDVKGRNKVLPMIIKSAPRMKKHRKKLPVRLFFLQEIRFYTEIFPAFVAFQNERNVAVPFKAVPNCYKTIDTEYDELLVIENIEETGFVELDDALEQDDAHVRLIFRECGRFHAISLAMKDQDLGCFERLTKNIHYPFSTVYMDAAMKKTFVKKSEWITSVFDKETEFEVYEVVAKFQEGIWELLKSLDIFDGDYGVVTHGSSTYFKCQETTPPTDLRFTDLERWTLTTPITDIAYPFYVSANQERLNHLEEYLKIYHDSMREHLSEMGSDIDNCFPFAALKEEWRKYAKVGLLMSILIFTHECAPVQEYSDSDSSSDSESSEESCSIIRVSLESTSESSSDSDSDSSTETLNSDLEKSLKHNRFRNIILHFYENGFL